jgi:hypothetical protein
MKLDTIEQSFQQKISTQIQVLQEGLDRYRILSPFHFNDGDHLVILLKQIGLQWFFTDEGHTFMHLTYSMDEKELYQGTRQNIISSILNSFGINDRNGELVAEVNGDLYGDTLYSFIQALIKISDITYLTRERARSTFMEDFYSFMEEQIPKERRILDWHDPINDPRAIYPVDLHINHMEKPLFVFAINGDNKARDVTINFLQYEKWGLKYQSMVVFENQEDINRKVLARLSDVCGKMFSNLGDKARISRFIEETI